MAVHVQRGKLLLSFFYRGVRCKEYTQLDDTAANRKDCERKLKIINHQIKGGTFEYEAWFPNSQRAQQFSTNPVTDLTVKQYLDLWMKQRCPLRPDGTLKPDFKLHIETWRHDQGTVRIFNEAFGHLKLAELSPVHVKQLRAELEQTRSGVTVSKYLYLLNSAMNEAVEDRLIRQSPMPRLRAVRSKPVPRREYSAEDRVSILSNLPAQVDLDSGAQITRSTLHDLFSTWMILGWRDSEILALRFDDVDAKKQVIHVRRARSGRANPLNPALPSPEDRPKTGYRLVPIGWAPQILQMVERRKRESLATGRRDYLFSDTAGEPIRASVLVRRVWNPTLRSIGLATDESVSDRSSALYSLRHGAIDNMVKAGFPVQVIEKITGTSKKMILEHYLNVHASVEANTGRRYIDAMTKPPSDRVSADVSASLPEDSPEIPKTAI